MVTQDNNILYDTAPNPYFFKNVIRKPKPMKIITCTSWNAKEEQKFSYIFLSDIQNSPERIIQISTTGLR